MFKFRVYAKLDNANRSTLIAATDYRDVAEYIKANIAKAFDADRRVAISMTESRDADFFSRLQRDDNAVAEDADADS